MNTKVCRTCQEEKTLDHYSFKNRAKGIYSKQCKQCHNAYVREQWYTKPENRKKQIAASKKTNDRNRSANRQRIWDYLLKHPCIDCGETNPVVLEFDHIDRKTKKKDISRMTSSYGWPPIEKEINKCEVRCANCHRIKTAKDLGWYLWL